MEKTRTTLFSKLFPWLAPLVISFAVADGGIEVQLYRNNRLYEKWHPSQLRRLLPAELTKWIEDHHIHLCPQPYPLVKQLWQHLIPHASKKFIIDASVLAEFAEIKQPQNFALMWMLNATLERIEGHYAGVDHYLGLGWFQKGTNIWFLQKCPPNAMDLHLRSRVVPLQQAQILLKTTIPALQAYLPTRADFQLITDFAMQVIVAEARSGGLILKLQSNYPQFLSTLQVSQQKADVLLADRTIISFPRQMLTPLLSQLIQKRSSIILQGADVPLFIREQLPIMRQRHQISDEMAAKITQSNPIVSIAELKPVSSFTHEFRHGIGNYAINAKYVYNQHKLDMSALLAAHQRDQRFIQQHGIWFEWPVNSRELVNDIQRLLVTHALRPEEVMGFDTRRTALLDKQPSTTIQLAGAVAAERGHSACTQLQYHGLPGGIIGEAGVAKMFVDVCAQLWRDNRQAHILWLVPSNRKGSVTRAVNNSTITSYVTIASLVTLRDEPALFSRQWTLVLFQDLDQLLDGSFQSGMLLQLKWQWALTSVSSTRKLRSSAMRVLHLPEQYFGQFCTRYLFELEESYESPPVRQSATGLNAAQAAPSIMLRKEEPVRQAVVPPTPVFRVPTQPVVPKKEEPNILIPSRSLSFWEQARQWQDKSHGPVPMVSFQANYPVYTDMNTKELQWYFYWRNEVRNDRYPATDIGYIFVHVYEALGCIGFATSALACQRLITLWENYRGSFPIVDKYLVPWIADFRIVHELPFTAMQWYTQLLTIPNCTTDAQLIAEAWLRQGGYWSRMPSVVLYKLIGWESRIKSDQNKQQHTLDEIYHLAIASVGRYLKNSGDNEGIVRKYGKNEFIVKRVPFENALVEVQLPPIIISGINSAFYNKEFHHALGGILRYADYIDQKLNEKTTEPFAFKMNLEWQKAIEAALTKRWSAQAKNAIDQTVQKVPESSIQTPRPNVQLNPDARQEREAAMQRRIEEYRNLAQRRAEAQEAAIRRRIEEQKAVAEKAFYSSAELKPVRHAIELNQQKIVKLHEESELLQERLTVEDEEQKQPQILSEAEMASSAPMAPTGQQLPQTSMQINEKDHVEKAIVRAPDQNRAEKNPAQVSFPVKEAKNSKQQSSTASPVEQRIAVMKEYWHYFDEIHAHQAEGMKPLRAGQIANPLSVGFEDRFLFYKPTYQQLLPIDLLTEIDRLWGTIMLPRSPERIITEPFPHEVFTKTFGVALNFWHSCALNAWFACEEIFYLRDLGELEGFYHKEIQALRDMGTPISRKLFEDLAKTREQFVQPKPHSAGQSTRREGFEKLRDVISTYRRQWADVYLDKYIQKRYEIDVHEAKLSYSFATSDKGIPPTAKQFAKDAKDVANHWFGGDISEVYRAIKEPAPFKPQRIALLPSNKATFVLAVFEILMQRNVAISQQTFQIEKLTEHQRSQLNKFAPLVFWYIRLEEALGYPPILSTFGSNKFLPFGHASSIDEAWDNFSRAIKQALLALGVTSKLSKTTSMQGETASEVVRKPVEVPPESTDFVEGLIQANLSRVLDNAEADLIMQQGSAKIVPEIHKPIIENAQKSALLGPEQKKPNPLVPQAPAKIVPERVEPAPAPRLQPAVQLNAEAISKLREESEHLRERLMIETAEHAQVSISSMPDASPDPAPAVLVVSEARGATPEVDEDWQLILQQWQPEHWKIIVSSYEGQSDQLAVVGREVHRPISRLIDEINDPVAAQLDDYLIDPDTQTLSPHLLAIAGSLVHWYLSSKGR